jgi:hypothetical protein
MLVVIVIDRCGDFDGRRLASPTALVENARLAVPLAADGLLNKETGHKWPG